MAYMLLLKKSLNLKLCLFIFLLFGLINFIFLLPFILNGQLPCHGTVDTNRFFVPVRAFGISEINNGRFPQLLPIFSGHDIASYGQGYFYPTFLISIFLKIPDAVFFLCDLWIHWTLAVFFMTIYLMRIRLTLLSALVGAVIYAYSGPILWRFQGHWTFVHQIPFLPALLILIEEIISQRWLKKKILLTVIGGLLIGILLLAQNPQFLYYQVFVLVPYVVIRLLIKRSKNGIVGSFLSSVLMIILGILLAAPTFLPMMFSLNDSFRKLLAGEQFASGWSLCYPHFYALIYPDFFFTARGYYGRWTPIESLFAVGSGGLLLALVGFTTVAFSKTSRSKIRIMLPFFLFFTAIFLGFGEAMPWFQFLVDHLPMYGSFRAHGRISFLIILAISILAAEGAESLTNTYRQSGQKQKAHTIFFLSVFSAIIAVISIWLLTQFSSLEKAYSWLNARGLAVGWTQNPTEQDIDYLRISAIKSITPVLIMSLASALFTIFSLFAIRQRKAIFGIEFLLLFFLICRDVNTHRETILTKMSPPIQDVIPPKIKEHLKSAAELPPPHGKICIISDNFQNITLIYPKLEDVSGVDGNLSARYGKYLNKVQKMKPDVVQMNALILLLEEDILKEMSVRWVLLDKEQRWKNLLPEDKFVVLAEENNLILIEYKDWTKEITCFPDSAAWEVLEMYPGYLKMKVGKAGGGGNSKADADEKEILFKSVASPYWKARFNDAVIDWTEDTPWMRVKIKGEGILEFKFNNIWLRIGIMLSLLSIVIIVIIVLTIFKLFITK